MKAARLAVAVFFLLPAFVQGQIKLNPQTGFTLQSLSDDRVKPLGAASDLEVDFTADIGWTFGLDTRIGSRFYFQPGAFFARNVTITQFKGDTLSINTSLKDKIVRSSLRLKALAGCNLLHKDKFKLRLNAGPSYDFIMSVDYSRDKLDFKENDFKGGSFNLDGGLGIDLWFLTAEIGYIYSLTNAFEEDQALALNSRYSTFYFTLGMAFGKDKSSKKDKDK